MATLHSPHPVSGSIGDFTYSRCNGKTIIRQKPGISREKFRTHPELQRSRENAQAFGGISKIACAIYAGLGARKQKILAPYSHNKLIARLRKGMRRHDFLVEEIRFTDIAHLLRNIDLSPNTEVSKRIHATTLGPNHCPDTLILNGIHQAASLAQGRSRNRIEFRIELKYIEVPEVTHRFNKEWTYLKGDSKHTTATSDPTNWIPVEILPNEPLRISLHHAFGKQLPTPVPKQMLPRNPPPNQSTQSPSCPETSSGPEALEGPEALHANPNQHPNNSHLSTAPEVLEGLISHQNQQQSQEHNQQPNNLHLSSLILHQNQQQTQQPNNSHLSTLISHQNQQQNQQQTQQQTQQPKTITSPNSPHLVFLLIEFREVNEDTNQITLLKDKTIARLVALQMDQATAEQIAKLPPIPKPVHEPIDNQWRQNPTDYLNNALANLQAPPPS